MHHCSEKADERQASNVMASQTRSGEARAELILRLSTDAAQMDAEMHQRCGSRGGVSGERGVEMLLRVLVDCDDHARQ